MYLLDNSKNIVWDELKAIYGNINSVDELRNDNLLEENKLDKILFKIFKQIKFIKSEDTLKNLNNLFANPPLNMSQDSINFMFDNTLKIKNFINNKKDDFAFKPEEINSIFDEYRKRVDIEIKKSTETSYNIVGMIHKSLIPLCYGNKIYDKKDMDELLFYIDNKKEQTLNKELDNNLKNEIIELINKTFVDESKKNELLERLEENDINNVMDIISNKISEIDNNTFKNAKKDLLNNYKRTLNLNIKNQIYSKIQTLTLSDDYKKSFFDLLNSNFKSEDIYVYLDYFNNEIDNKKEEITKAMISAEKFKIDEVVKDNIILTLMDSLNSLSLSKHQIVNFINSKEEIENLELSNYVTKVKRLEGEFIVEQAIKNNIKLSSNIDSLKINQNNEYNDILKSYQSINQTLLENKEYRDNHINLSVSKKTNHSVEKSNTIELFKIQDINKYSLNDVKQMFLLLNSDNKTIYNINKTTDLLKNIDKNILFINLFKEKYPNMDEEVLKRIKYLYEIIVLKDNLKNLLIPNLTLDIEKYLFKANDNVEHVFSKDAINVLLNKFNELKEDNLFKNKPNILMGILIYSFNPNDLIFNNDKFNALSNILKTNKSNLLKDERDLNLLETINDNWLKWSLIYGREIKDVSLTNKGINPLTFDFTNHQTMKQIVEKYKIEKSPTKELGDFKFDNDFYQVYNLYSNINSKRVNEKTIPMLYQAMENIPENMKSYFISACKHLNNIKDTDIFKTHYKKELNHYYKNFYTFINNTIKTFYFEKKLNFTNQESFISIYKTILNSNNKNDKVFQDLNILKELFDNNLKIELKSTIDTFKKIGSTEINKYVAYYKEMHTKHNIENFDIKDSKIPILEKNLGDGYSYKVITVKNFDVLLAGEQSNCCMTLGGQGWNIYKHMFEKPKESMIFNVYKNGKVVANSWVWLQNKQLTFDNIEVLGNEVRNSIKKAYFDYSFQVLNKSQNIDKITYGLGNGDIRDFGVANTSFNTLTNYRNYYGHGDSSSQKTILAKNNTTLLSSQINLLINEAKAVNVDDNIINEFINKNNLNMETNNRSLF